MYKILKAETLAAKIHLMVVHAPLFLLRLQPRYKRRSFSFQLNNRHPWILCSKGTCLHYIPVSVPVYFLNLKSL